MSVSFIMLNLTICAHTKVLSGLDHCRKKQVLVLCFWLLAREIYSEKNLSWIQFKFKQAFFFVGSCITKNVHTPIELCTKQILIRLICIFDTFNIWSWQTKRTKKIFGPTLMRIIDKVKGCDWFHPLRVIWANEKKNQTRTKDTETERNGTAVKVGDTLTISVIFLHVNVQSILLWFTK